MAEPVNVSQLSEADQKHVEMYGRLPKARPAALAKQQRVPHDSADRELSKLSGAKSGPVKPAGNPLLMRKAPPPRVNPKPVATEPKWHDDTPQATDAPDEEDA